LSAPLRRTLAGINAGIALAHVGNYLYFPILIATLGSRYSGFWAGFVMFLTYVGRLASTFCYPGVNARLGNRGGVVAGVLVEAVALGLMGFGHGLAAYSTLAFFVGFGSGLSFPGLKNILSGFPEQHRPKAFSSFQMSCQLGALVGALLGGLFLGVGLRLLFGVVFALFLGYCLAAAVLLPADPPQPARDRSVPLVDLAVLRGLRAGGGARYFVLSSLFWLLSINFLVGIPLHMQAYVGSWPTSMPFWVAGVTLLVLQYPAFRFMIRRFQPGQVMATAFAAMALAYGLFGAGRTAAFVVAGCLVVVLGDILFTPSFDLWVAGRIPADRLAKAMGAMHFFRSFGNMVGTLVAGALFDLSRLAGVPGLNWYLVGALALVCAAVSLSTVRREAAPVVVRDAAERARQARQAREAREAREAAGGDADGEAA
jgi:MFS transporter, DHA1 family, multidrug resistance protein